MVAEVVRLPRRRDGHGATVHAQDTRAPEAEGGAGAKPPAGGGEPGGERGLGGLDGEPGPGSWGLEGDAGGVVRRDPGGAAVRLDAEAELADAGDAGLRGAARGAPP